MVKHLFLLVGKNPLPNYVAAKLLIEQGSTVHFVYSTETEIFKKNLDSKLRSQLGTSFFSSNDIHLTDPSDALDIKNAVKPAFDNIGQYSEIDLNYTGGTKAMSVHVYRAIEEFGKAKNCISRFSYLDPRKLKLCYDNQSAGLTTAPIGLNQPSSDGFKKTKLKLREIIELHSLIFQRRGDNFEKFPFDKVRFPDLLAVLSELRSDENKWQIYQTFRNESYKRLEFPNQNTEITIPNELDDLIEPINKIGRQFCGKDLIENGILKFGNLTNQSHRKSLGKFLLSTWLESFVLQKIIEVADENIEDFGTSLFIAKPNNPIQTFMEIDVFAVRGYQLFAISCSVAKDKDERKDKLFEIAHRAKQLGGDEARIGLVCFAEGEQLISLKNQLKEDNIKVFGKPDLKELEIGLKSWFNGK